jgi:hypothetical protein
MCRHVIKEQFAGGVGDTNYLKIFIARERLPVCWWETRGHRSAALDICGRVRRYF